MPHAANTARQSDSRQPLPYKYILSGVSGHSIQFLARTLSYLASITLGQSHQLQRTPTHT